MIQRSSIFWGIVLILLGGLFLVDNLDMLEINFWRFLGPVLLIFLGLWVLIAYFVKPKLTETETLSIPINSAKRAIIEIQHGAGKFKLKSNTESNQLMYGTFDQGVSHSVTEENDALKVSLKLLNSKFPVLVFPWFLGSSRNSGWNIHLTERFPLNIEMKIGASEALIDMSDLQVEQFKLDTVVSSTMLILPEAVPYMNAVINAGIASLKVIIPEQVSAKIRLYGGLMDFKINKSRFPKSAGYFQSPEYDTASQKLELRIDGGIGSVTIL